GILGLIGWAYFVATTLYLLLRREHLTALLGAAAVLMCLFFADRAGAFEHLRIPLGVWIIHPTSIIGSIGETLGSQASITMMGVLLGAMLLPTSMIQSPRERMRLAGVLALMMAFAALLLHRTYGINKNAATPSWCLWSMAITTVLWMALYAVI